jgi:hypothetical protein
MPTRDDLFPSRYLKAADLAGKSHIVTISMAIRETFKNGTDEQQKLVVFFKGKKKGLVTNLTNFDAIMDITGQADADDWRGHQIEIYPTTTEMRGKTVDCIRIRSPEQGEPSATKRPAKPPPSAEMDDGIPF